MAETPAPPKLVIGSNTSNLEKGIALVSNSNVMGLHTISILQYVLCPVPMLNCGHITTVKKV